MLGTAHQLSGWIILTAQAPWKVAGLSGMGESPQGTVGITLPGTAVPVVCALQRHLPVSLSSVPDAIVLPVGNYRVS